MKYCSSCATPLISDIPQGDDRERRCCPNCGDIHYVNPKIIVGCLPIWEDKILMCKRGIEPRAGYWTLPGGFMELNETTEQGALRETWEEARLNVEITALHGIYNIPRINQVYFFYLAKMLTPDFELTPESTEIKLYTKDEIPWNELAFRVIDVVLKQYIENGDDITHCQSHEKIESPYFHSEIIL